MDLIITLRLYIIALFAVRSKLCTYICPEALCYLENYSTRSYYAYPSSASIIQQPSVWNMAMKTYVNSLLLLQYLLLCLSLLMVNQLQQAEAKRVTHPSKFTAGAWNPAYATFYGGNDGSGTTGKQFIPTSMFVSLIVIASLIISCSF